MSLPPEIEAAALVGFAMYPSSRYSKAACFKGASDAATSDLDQLSAWAREYNSPNWRVVMAPSGIWGLDLDVPPGHASDGIKNFADLCAKHGGVPPRPTLRSGGGGLALFFSHRGERIIGESGKPAPGIDPRRGRQSQTIPPSIHVRTKAPYRWIPGQAPWEISAPVAPAWLCSLLAPPPEPSWHRHPWTPTDERARNAVMRAIHAVQDAPGGSANITLYKQAFRLGMWCGAGLLPQSDATESLYSAARHRHIPDREARDTIKSGFASGLRKPMEARHAG